MTTIRAFSATLLLSALATSAFAQSGVTEVTPGKAAHDAALNADVSVTHAPDLQPGGGAVPLILRGEQSGAHTATLSGSTQVLFPGGGSGTQLDFANGSTFYPGEMVEATLPGGIPTIVGGNSAPFVWRFRTATNPATADFLQKQLPHVNFSGANVNSSTGFVAAGDLNGDGWVDFVYGGQIPFVDLNPPSYGSDARIGLAVFLNDTKGGFPQADEVLIVKSSAWVAGESPNFTTVLLGDIDGDGDLDLITVGNAEQDQDRRNVIYRNNGLGQFSASDTITLSTGRYTEAATLGDIDGDGDIDIIEGNVNNTQSYVHFNDGSGNFTEQPVFTIQDWVYGLALGDIDGDGDLDIAVANRAQFIKSVMPSLPANFPEDRQSYFYINDGSGNLTKGAKFGTAIERTHAVDFGDVDGDGDLDLLVAEASELSSTHYAGEGIRVYINDSTWTSPTASATPVEIDSGFKAFDARFGDLDGDGDLDIVMAQASNFALTNRSFGATVNGGLQLYRNSNFIYINDTTTPDTAIFNTYYPVWIDDNWTANVVLADVDDDGDLDIIDSNAVRYNGLTETLYFASSPTLGQAIAGLDYRAKINTVYGIAPLAWSISGQPAWLAIDAATGELSGTPPAGSSGTSVSFDVMVANSGGSGLSRTQTFTLPIGDAATLPFSDDFESGNLDRYGVFLGSSARAMTHADAAQAGTLGLKLDALPGLSNWPLQQGANPPGQAAADDPARWAVDAPNHVSAVEWTVAGGGATAVNVSFDYRTTTSSSTNSWYANLLFEWSDDLGATWNIASGTSALSSGIYRKYSSSFTKTSFAVSGINNASGYIKFRLSSLVKLSNEHGSLATFVSVDNLSITASTTGPVQPTITTASLAAATEGAAWQSSIAATGVTAPLTWSLTGAPAWLSINAVTGIVSGTPPTGSAGSHTFTVTVADSATPAGSASKTLTLTVVGGSPVITTAALAAGIEGQDYSASLNANGGVGPYTWSVVGAPAWLSINAVTGVLSGKPSVGSGGTLSLTVTVTDSSTPTAKTDSKALQLTIAPPAPLVITTATSLPGATEGTPYSATLTGTGGVKPYTWSLSGAPSWLVLDPQTGGLSGTPQTGDAGLLGMSVTLRDGGAPPKFAGVPLILDVLPPKGTSSAGAFSIGAAGCALSRDNRSAGFALIAAFLAVAACPTLIRRRSLRVLRRRTASRETS